MTLHIADFESRTVSGRPGALLRMDPRVEALYEAEHRAERIASARVNILVGLTLYNSFSLTSLLLIPDTAPGLIIHRAGIMIPFVGLLFWLMPRVGGAARELLFFLGMCLTISGPALALALSKSPLAGYAFAEHTLMLVFANMLLVLRFRYAIVFTVFLYLLMLGSLHFSEVLEPRLLGPFVLYLSVGCAFALYANYLIERARCQNFLSELMARLRSEAADVARRKYEGLSLTDSLTGLPNRRALEFELDRLVDQNRTIAVLMIDVDHFKAYNDRLGHPAGDACLRAIATALSVFARDHDYMVARFGGEEFTLVVRSATELETMRIAQTLLRGIGDLGIVHPARSEGSGVITVSIGAALRAPGGDTAWETVLAAADKALYAAKRRGRNCWVMAEDPAGLLKSAD